MPVPVEPPEELEPDAGAAGLGLDPPLEREPDDRDREPPDAFEAAVLPVGAASSASETSSPSAERMPL